MYTPFCVDSVVSLDILKAIGQLVLCLCFFTLPLHIQVMYKGVKTHLGQILSVFHLVPVLHLDCFLTDSRWLLICERICFTVTPDKITNLMNCNICHFKMPKNAVWSIYLG